ncbi:N-terminal domain of NEFA-interacting nuclear protein NIP30-domain-containing protein [Apiospora rasikravindrae]|uniref:N-terminal domain of NEFA-interacting nuclear protein NIP30-domain-containing protein n=1 Tax=Apiospora rasikravindrae TaxID=990691 RepID=A0ABR1TCN3_9PEZI
MSSRFVSGGTLPGDTTAAAETTTSTTPATAAAATSSQPTPSPTSTSIANSKPSTSSTTTATNKNAAEWARVQSELEASRAARDAARRANGEGGAGEEKSLEANRLRNQFRALDDDEVDFLDEVQEKERQEEERKRRELEEGLGKFRQAQGNKGGQKEGIEQEGEEVVPTEDLASEWAGAAAGGAGRKRKREKEVLFKGLKRKSTSEGAQEKGAATANANGAAKTTPQASGTSPAPKAEQVIKPPAAAKPTAPKPALGLVAYGSDDDDDD